VEEHPGVAQVGKVETVSERREHRPDQGRRVAAPSAAGPDPTDADGRLQLEEACLLRPERSRAHARRNSFFTSTACTPSFAQPCAIDYSVGASGLQDVQNVQIQDLF
jgi:hypothetical protein